MSIRDIGLRFIVFIITLSCVFTLIVSSSGFCDDWVYVGKNDYLSIYYNKTNIKIEQDSKQIKVWIKMKYTKKGKERYLNDRKAEGLTIKGFNDISDTVNLIHYDYNNLKEIIISIANYSMSGEVLSRDELNEVQWHDILPESINVSTLNRILKDYNIHR